MALRCLVGARHYFSFTYHFVALGLVVITHQFIPHERMSDQRLTWRLKQTPGAIMGCDVAATRHLPISWPSRHQLLRAAVAT